MLEHSVYSVASPEGTAAILWRDSSKAPDAARAMKITAQDLHELGIADAIVAEPEGGAHTDTAAAIAAVGEASRAHLAELALLDLPTLIERRYAKYRAIGRFQEGQAHLLARANGSEPASPSLPFS